METVTPPVGARSPLSYGAFAACSLIWGSTFLFISIGNESVPPVWAAALRLGLAAAILLAVARLRNDPLPRGAALQAAALYGLFGFGVNFPLLYWAEQVVPSGVTAVFYATMPLTTAFLAAGFGIERLDATKLTGAAVALGGVALIFSGQLGLDVRPLPLLVLLVSSSAAALGNVLLKRGPHHSAIGTNAVGAVVGFAVCVALSLALREPHPFPATARQLVPILYLTLAGSVGAYVLMVWLVQRWGVTSTSFIVVVVPVIALVLGVAVRGEDLPPASLLGAAVVIAGVGVGLFGNRPRPVRVAAGDCEPPVEE